MRTPTTPTDWFCVLKAGNFLSFGNDKKEARELDELFEAIKNEKERTLGLLDLHEIYKKAYSLKDKEWWYVQDLLLVVQELQSKNEVPFMISRSDMYATSHNHIIESFLRRGGFKKYRKKEWWKNSYVKKLQDTAIGKIVDKIILVAVTFIATLWICKPNTPKNNQRPNKIDSLQKVVSPKQ